MTEEWIQKCWDMRCSLYVSCFCFSRLALSSYVVSHITIFYTLFTFLYCEIEMEKTEIHHNKIGLPSNYEFLPCNCICVFFYRTWRADNDDMVGTMVLCSCIFMRFSVDNIYMQCR